jgi:hypothetical protein
MILQPVEGRLDLGSVAVAALGGEIRCSVDTREYFTGVSSSTSMD